MNNQNISKAEETPPATPEYESFVFYPSMRLSIERQDGIKKCELAWAYMEYGTTGSMDKVPEEFKGIVSTVAKPIEASKRRFKESKKTRYFRKVEKYIKSMYKKDSPEYNRAMNFLNTAKDAELRKMIGFDKPGTNPGQAGPPVQEPKSNNNSSARYGGPAR